MKNRTHSAEDFKNLQQATKEQLHKKNRVFIAFMSVALSAVAVVSATYAWFSISRTPTVNNLDLSVLAENRLEIAPDENGTPGEWDVVLDLSTVLNDVVPLRTVTYSQSRNTFYAMNYGTDGRPAGATVALSDEQNASVKGIGNQSAEAQGYYIAVTFWVRASSSAVIGLSEAQEVEEGLGGAGTYVIGNPVWNGSAVAHENGGNGLETALRVGFRCQSTDIEGNPTGDSRFVIYEPNADTHVDGTTGYTATPSIDGGNSLVSEDNLIWQTTSRWNETTPTLSDSVVYNLGNFQTETELFNIGPEKMEKVTLYVWLEGQDVDCVNMASAHETSVLANIQLTPLDADYNTGVHRE